MKAPHSKPFCEKNSACAIEKPLDSQSDLDRNGMLELNLDSEDHNLEQACTTQKKARVTH